MGKNVEKTPLNESQWVPATLRDSQENVPRTHSFLTPLLTLLDMSTRGAWSHAENKS